MKTAAILAACAIVVGLPFLLQPRREASDWRPGDPELVIISPHNEAIRREFGAAFSRWHRERYGQVVRVDWRSIGGTTEIMRYLGGEYGAAFKAWWRGQGRPWTDGALSAVMDGRFAKRELSPEEAKDPAARERWDLQKALWQAFRAQDDPQAFGSGIDLFFGGGAYDHGKAFDQGFTVPPWPADAPPPGLLAAEDGTELIPTSMGGEIWRTDTFFGTALSTFGICYNVDRVRELGLPGPPSTWADLVAPAYVGQVGMGDPTKSGSLAKAFEMIVHEQCRHEVDAAGFSGADIEAFELDIARDGVPGEGGDARIRAYQAAVERGWLRGIRLVQRISANARYFTDSAGKVPIDVSMGSAAAGLAIDFYGRYQAETSRAPDGAARMGYVTPAGGSSVSADPISLLRGAAHRELAVRFIAFALSDEGQKLWNYRPGTPGGPAVYALRRLPIRRDFYPSDSAARQAVYESHRPFTSDPLGDPAVNPYVLASEFTYRPRWTGAHFGMQRTLIKAMCLDSGDELRAAWRAILDAGGPEACPEAVAALERMPDDPEPLTWASAPGMFKRHDPLDTTRRWTLFFRRSYAEARERAEGAEVRSQKSGVRSR